MYFALLTINQTIYTMKKIKATILLTIIGKSISSIVVTIPCIVVSIKLLSMINTISFDGVATPIALSLLILGLASILNYVIWRD